MSSNKYKILVVEDEANIRSFVETSLEAGRLSGLYGRYLQPGGS